MDQVVVFGRAPEKPAKISGHFGFATTTDLDAVIADASVDLFDICLPAGTASRTRFSAGSRVARGKVAVRRVTTCSAVAGTTPLRSSTFVGSLAAPRPHRVHRPGHRRHSPESTRSSRAVRNWVRPRPLPQGSSRLSRPPGPCVTRPADSSCSRALRPLLGRNLTKCGWSPRAGSAACQPHSYTRPWSDCRRGSARPASAKFHLAASSKRGIR